VDIGVGGALPVFGGSYAVFDTYRGDGAFWTGTCGARTPVSSIDGRVIGTGRGGPVFDRIRNVYREWVSQTATGG